MLASMRAAPCVEVALGLDERVALLKEEYAHFVADPDALDRRLAHLVELHGKETLARWSALAHGGDIDALVAELLSSHYDPTYSRAMTRNYAGLADARRVTPSGIAPASWRALARSLLTDAEGAPCPPTRSASSTCSPNRRSPATRSPSSTTRAASTTRRCRRSRCSSTCPRRRSSCRPRPRPRACASSRPRSRCRSPAIRRSAPAHVVRDVKGAGDRVTLEMKAGVIPVEANGDTWTLEANAPKHRAPAASSADLAAMLGLARATSTARRCGSTPARTSS
jgi:hypothetical protein